MKRSLYIMCVLLLAFAACSKQDFTIDEAYEQAEIKGIELYNRQMARADKTTSIDSENGTALVILKPNQDISDLKISVSSSTGSEISPFMSVGFQDFSAPKTYEITSAGKSVVKTWTITVAYP